MDVLDQKLNQTFEGKVVRKDLLHRIKKGTNVPSKDSGVGVLTGVTSESDYHNYGKRPAAKARP